MSPRAVPQQSPLARPARKATRTHTNSTNSKQITCWELAIDLLLKLEKVEDRRLVWARAMRFNWSALGRQFGCHRVTIQRRYKSIILDLEFKLDKITIDRIDNLI